MSYMHLFMPGEPDLCAERARHAVGLLPMLDAVIDPECGVHARMMPRRLTDAMRREVDARAALFHALMTGEIDPRWQIAADELDRRISGFLGGEACEVGGEAVVEGEGGGGDAWDDGARDGVDGGGGERHTTQERPVWAETAGSAGVGGRSPRIGEALAGQYVDASALVSEGWALWLFVAGVVLGGRLARRDVHPCELVDALGAAADAIDADDELREAMRAA